MDNETFHDKTNSNSHFIIYLISILPPVLIVYREDLLILYREGLYNESVSHVLLVPFLVGILVYEKRDLVKAALTFGNKDSWQMDTIMGACLCLLAIQLYWYGSYTFYPLEYHLLSLPLFLSGGGADFYAVDSPDDFSGGGGAFFRA